MSEEKKCLNREELPEGVTELSMEDLEQVTGGVFPGMQAVKPSIDPDGNITCNDR